MTKEELYDLVLARVKVINIHPFHKAALEECCENVLQSEGDHDQETLIYSTILGFGTTIAVVRGMFKGLLTDYDQITLNYRDSEFIIDRNSPLLSD